VSPVDITHAALAADLTALTIFLAFALIWSRL
jgi:hypothetical protein